MPMPHSCICFAQELGRLVSKRLESAFPCTSSMQQLSLYNCIELRWFLKSTSSHVQTKCLVTMFECKPPDVRQIRKDAGLIHKPRVNLPNHAFSVLLYNPLWSSAINMEKEPSYDKLQSVNVSGKKMHFSISYFP